MEFELRELNYAKLSNRLKKWGKKTNFEARAWNMYSGDMWDGGYGYIGPSPVQEDPDFDRVYSLISKAFTSRNVVSEVVDRLIAGLFARSPNWTIYDQTKLLSKSIEAAQRRLEAQNRALAADTSIEELVNQEEPEFKPRKTSTPRISASNNNGNINVDIKDESSTSPESEKIDPRVVEAEIILGRLWTDLNLKKVISQAMAQRLVTGRSCLRLYIPKKYQDEEGNIKKLSILDAVEGVRAEWIDKENGKVIDQEGDRLSIARLEKSKNGIQSLKGIEVSFVDDATGLTHIAVYEPANQTKATLKKKGEKNSSLQNIDENNIEVDSAIEDLKKEADVSDGLFLDGNLTMEQLEGEPYVTEQLLQNNRALNLDLTLGVNVLVEDGFTEMITTNASIEYTEVPDPSRPGQMMKIAKSLKRGSSSATNLIGVQTFDEKGMKTYQTPGVTFRQPTTLSAFESGENLYYRQCLAEGKQMFVLAIGDITVSGESRIQQRQDFVNKCYDYKPEADKLGGWMMPTLLHLVAIVAGKPGYFKGLGVNFDTRVTAGELSADEKNVVITRYEKHLISRENAMVLLGSEDPLIELDQIRADEAELLEQQTRRLVVTSRFSDMIQADKELNDGKTTGSNPKQRDNKRKKDKKINV